MGRMNARGQMGPLMDPPADRDALTALRKIIAEVDSLISTSEPMPEDRTPRCRELLQLALMLTEGLMRHEP